MPVLESVFNKVSGLRACNFITKKLQHRCFPVKFSKCLRIPILKNIYERLPLYFQYNSHIIFTIIALTTVRSSRSQIFYKIGVVKNFANFACVGLSF